MDEAFSAGGGGEEEEDVEAEPDQRRHTYGGGARFLGVIAGEEGHKEKGKKAEKKGVQQDW